MTIHRFWRLTGICTGGNGTLALSEARLYEAGALADSSATLTATMAPATGVMSSLRDEESSDMVTWPYTVYSQPGFALVWDFGSGFGVDAAALRLGAGSAESTFPLDLVLQYSEDGLSWTTFESYTGVGFPGVWTMTPEPPASGSDPYFSKVVFLLHGDGANGSTSFSEVNGNTVTPSGNTQISTAKTKTGGSSMLFDGAGDYLTIPSKMMFDLGDIYTIDCWVNPNSITSNFGLLHRGFYTTTNNSWSGMAFSTRWLGSALRVYFYATGFADEQYLDIPGAFTAGVWTHLEIGRSGTTGYVFINGTLAGTKTGLSTPAASAQPLKIGVWDYSAGAEYFNGYLQDVRITLGAIRHTAAFTPSSARLPDSTGGIVLSPFAHVRQSSPFPLHLLPEVALPNTAVAGHLRETQFFDAYNGGVGMIYGTTKEKNTPANTPLRRRVLLIDEASRMTIRETWSDAATGNYEFRGVKQGVKYTVISYDHLHNYRAVIADNQDAT